MHLLSSVQPPIHRWTKTHREDIFTLGEYLGREQYGQRPLFYGQAYTSQVALEKDGEYCRPVMKEGAPVWQRKEKASADEKDEFILSCVIKTNTNMPVTCSSPHV